ncbi:unnamed protein product [Ectocarpus sp. 12 AP-2014]
MVHIDKPIITENQPLFFKGYSLTGPNKIRATLSKVLKVELLNGNKELLAIEYHKIEDGMAQGAFNVPKNLKEGAYTLRADTRWLQN